MKKRLKEKPKNDDKFNVDNEIIIGIKTLPDVKPKKNKVKNKSKTKKVKKKNKNNEFKLQLGIEDKPVKSNKKVPKKTTKKQQIKKKKRKIIYKMIKFITFILIIMGGGIYFMLSPVFNIENIVVTGNNILTTEQIKNLSDIHLEENTFKLVKSKTEEKIKQNAYIQNVKIKRKLPSTITIEVEERIPTYIISFANAYAYINNQGYFLEISKEKLNLPIITGYTTSESDICEGNRLCIEDLQRLENVLQIMKATESNEISSLVTKINIADKQNYILELQKEKKTVYLGDTSNLSTKMLYIKSILEQNKNIEGEIFVNTDLNSKGAIFRKKV